MTRVLPEPAPASTRQGPPRWCTASSWAGLSEAAGSDTGGGRRCERGAGHHSGAARWRHRCAAPRANVTAPWSSPPRADALVVTFSGEVSIACARAWWRGRTSPADTPVRRHPRPWPKRRPTKAAPSSPPWSTSCNRNPTPAGSGPSTAFFAWRASKEASRRTRAARSNSFASCAARSCGTCPRRSAGRWSCASCAAHDRADLWNLRSHLFGAISLAHGEHVARERLQQLDAHWN